MCLDKSRPRKPRKNWWPKRPKKSKQPSYSAVTPKCPTTVVVIHQAPSGTLYHRNHNCHRTNCPECQGLLAIAAIERAKMGFRKRRRWAKWTVNATLHPDKRAQFWKACWYRGMMWTEVTRREGRCLIVTFFYEVESGGRSAKGMLQEYSKAASAYHVTRRGFSQTWPITAAIRQRRNDTRLPHEKHQMIAVSKHTGTQFAKFCDEEAGIRITPGMTIKAAYIPVMVSMKLLKVFSSKDAFPLARPVTIRARKVRTLSAIGIESASEFNRFRWHWRNREAYRILDPR